MESLKEGKPEVSLFVRIGVSHQGNIYALDFKKVLTKDGWKKSESLPKGFETIIIKVRADKINKRAIVDIKTSSGDVRKRGLMKKKICDYKYDLSAALYFDIFSLLEEYVNLKDFIWIFISKDDGATRVYRASKMNILVGRAKYVTALRNIAP